MPYTGRTLLALVGIVTSTGGFIADWNETHIYNGNWPPHAKYHNAQTMSMGLVLGMLTLYYLYRPAIGMNGPSQPSRNIQKAAESNQLNTATVIASLYWITQLMAVVYPGVGGVDPPQDPTHFPQVYISGVLLSTTALGYYLETKRIARPSVQTIPRKLR